MKTIKIDHNGVVTEYTRKEVRDLTKHGGQFDYDLYRKAYVPKRIQIYDNDMLYDTTMEELTRRRMKKEKFLKLTGKPIYVSVDAEMYNNVMRPIWAEKKREQRRLKCIYKGKRFCKRCNCDGCTSTIYAVESIDAMEENGGIGLPCMEDVRDVVLHKELYAALCDEIQQCDDVDQQIIFLKANGKSEREIASELNFKSKTSVVKRWEKIRARLRQRIENFI